LVVPVDDQTDRGELSIVQWIWSARGLKPHLVKTFKLSTDRHFEEKLIDVVGLYLNPMSTSIRGYSIPGMEYPPSNPPQSGPGNSMTLRGRGPSSGPVYPPSYDADVLRDSVYYPA
jgi:hypothetical protein